MGSDGDAGWVKGLSDRPGKAPPRGSNMVALLRAVGAERVAYPDGGTAALPMSRRELLARVLWTRAIAHGDLACARLLIEYLDGKPGAKEQRAAAKLAFTADDLAAVERLLGEWWAAKGRGAGCDSDAIGES